MKVVLSSHATADLGRIGRFIAQDNPARAVSFVNDLREMVRLLAEYPLRFPLVPRYEQYAIRRRPWKGYGVLYTVQPERIFVHRILGPGQDHDRVLGLN